MTVLVTGGTGFVGSHLLDRLAREDVSLVALRRLNSDMRHVAHLGNRVRWIDGDLRDPLSMRRLLEACWPDEIYHLGALSWVGPSWSMPASYMETNATGTIMLLEAAVAMQETCRILVSCTPEEYGCVTEDMLPITEDTPIGPVNPYAASKVAQDALCQSYQASYPKLQIIRTRAFNHEGPRRAVHGALASFAHQIARIEAGLQSPIVEVGNLYARRNFTHVLDMVEAYVLAMRFGVPGELYLIGSDYVHTIEECLNALLEKSRVPDIVQRSVSSRCRPTEVPLLVGDCRKFRTLTGWKPTRSFEQILDDILEYWREQVATGVA